MDPLSVHLYLTPQCNLNCIHCYYDALRTGDIPGRMLSVQEAVSVIKWLCKNFDADIHLEGGEPFLRSDLGEILAELSPTALGMLTITTNGTVPITVPVERLRRLGELRISIDGHNDDLQQALRPAKLETVFRTLGKLRADAVPFTVRTTLHRTNINCLAEMLASFVASGAERISLFEFQPVGRGAVSDLEQHVLAVDEFEGVLDELARRGPGAGVRLLKLSLSPQRIPLALARQTELEAQGFRFIDLLGVPNLTINSNGDLGVSPWMVTARQVHDRFASIFDPDYPLEVERRVMLQATMPPCPYTSGLLLRYPASD